MGTRCLFIFKQNIHAKEAHGVYVHYDGYPRGAADYLEETFNSDNTWTKLVRQTGCSRYEADEFAKNAVGTSASLVSALRKLHVENLSFPFPHSLISTFHHSHPTLMERERALLK